MRVNRNENRKRALALLPLLLFLMGKRGVLVFEKIILVIENFFSILRKIARFHGVLSLARDLLLEGRPRT